MKKVSLVAMATLLTVAVTAQQKEGKVTYERSTQMQIVMNNGGGDQPINRTRVDKFELNFANNQMSWKQLEEEMPEEPAGGGGMIIRTFGGGTDDMTFCDLTQSRKVEQREFFDKKFLVLDSIRRGNWKLTEETKSILNHVCRKATMQRYGKRMMMTMDNGQMVRKEIDDTTTLVAWFTTDIPVAFGPEIQGQLPGMILELESNNGRTTYKALEISPKANLSSIKEPTKGKKVSPDEFAKERNKMLEEMQKNNGGQIRFRAG